MRTMFAAIVAAMTSVAAAQGRRRDDDPAASSASRGVTPMGRLRIVLLLGLVVLAFGASLALSFRNEQRSRLEHASLHRANAWFAFQAERELLRLANVVQRRLAGEVAADAVRLQLELLRSRVDLMTAGSESEPLRADPGRAAEIDGAARELAAIEAAMAALLPGEVGPAAAVLETLEVAGWRLRNVTQSVMLGERAALRQRDGAFLAFAAFVACMLAAVAALVGLLLRELGRRSSLLRRATQAEAEAVAARTRLLDAIGALQDGFTLYDSDDRLVVWNEKYSEMYAGFAEAIVEGASFEDMVRCGLRKSQIVEAVGREEAWIAERLASHREPCGPLHQRLPDGRWIRINETRTRDGGIVGVRTDITALKRREAELAEVARAGEEARDRLIEAVEAFPGSFVMWDAQDRLALWNKKRETLYGEQRDLLRVGVNCVELLRLGLARGLYPHAAGREEEWMAEMAAWHRAPGRPLEVQLADGRWVRLENHRAASGCVVSVGLDVTESKQRERQLAQAQKMEAVGQLTGGIAHDFNNLLLVVKGNADWMLETLPADAAERKLAEAVRSAAERGASLVRRLLAFSRKQQLAPETLDVNELLGAAAGILGRTLGAQIDIHTDLAAGLPAVQVDRAQLETAVLNLAINARDAMPDGGRLSLSAQSADLDGADAQRLDVAPGRYVRIAVADNGEGMAPEVAERAFEPFFTTKEVDKGTGLGLSMVHGLLRQSGGAVELRSRQRLGTTVSLYLPASAAAADLIAPKARAESGAPRGSETVLVVEDDPAVRHLVTGLLRSFGYAVQAAASGREALDLLEGGLALDLLLTDLVMPGGIGGRELARRAELLRSGLPILFTSGFSADAASQRADPDFARRLLPKPYRRADLAVRVRAALDDVRAAAA